ncbi:MAG TPA: hypothetical protein EYN79_07175 [Planctomycetes bacterium]|nr:hypothetical protein [Planctomycetota bacterium]
MNDDPQATTTLMEEIAKIFTDPWVIFGLIAQALFFLRWIVQWIASEGKRRSVIPVSFWWLSIAGASGLLIYAIQRRDPVFIAGMSVGFIVYFRNLWLIYRGKGRETDRSG